MALPEIIKNLLENGVHFGHRSRNWNPKMKKFIFGKKSGVYIIDVEKTAQKLKEAADFLKELSARGGTILFVSTKRQAKEVIQKEAASIGAPYVAERWVGGLLTNFVEVRKRIKTYKDLKDQEASGNFGILLKKEVVRLGRKVAKMDKNFSGLIGLDKLPEAVCLIDPKKETLPVKEAKKLHIPIVALIDTDSDPDGIDYPIPGNDDALKSIRFITSCLIEAIKAGKQERETQRKEAELQKAKLAEGEKETAAATPEIEILEDAAMEKAVEEAVDEGKRKPKSKEA